ncbi:predicted protein, partial [Nematostella vectensis]
DPCLSKPCANGGTCSPISSGSDYTCACAAGYTGKNCTADVDECSSSPCQNGASCIKKVGRYFCECSTAHVGKNCHKSKFF